MYACIFLVFVIVLHAAGIPDRRSCLLKEHNLENALSASSGSRETSDILGTVDRIQESVNGERIILRRFSVIREGTVLKTFLDSPENENAADFCSTGFRVIAYMDGEIPDDLRCGDAVVLRGICSVPGPVTNPGQYDMNVWMSERNILFRMNRASVIRRGAANTPEGWLQRASEQCGDVFDRILAPDDSAMLRAIALGEKEMMPQQLKNIYQQGGILHIAAISGLHISLIGMSLWKLLRKRRHGFVLSGLCSLAVLVFYCIMTGMSVSALRSLTMFAVWVGAQILGRTNDLMTAAAAAALVCILRNPMYLKDGGFYLSFGCILSLALIRPVLEERIPKHPDGFRGIAGRALKVCLPSLSIQLGTLPLSAYFFYQITPWSFLVNLAVLPCMSVLLAAGIAGCAAGLFSVPAGTFLASPCHYLLLIFRTLCQWERYLPGSVFVTGKPELWQVLIYYLILATVLAGCRKKAERFRISTRRTIPLGIAGAMLVLLARTPVPFRVVFTDVGQGDGIYLHAWKWFSEPLDILIDCGSSSKSRIYSYTAQNMLKSYGVHDLDLIFATHGDQDHINGIEELIDGTVQTLTGQDCGGIEVRELAVAAALCENEDFEEIDSTMAELVEKAEQADITVGKIHAGDVIRYGDLKLQCLYPSAEDISEETNQNSLVFMLSYKGFRILLTGDNEKDGEKRLVDRYRKKLKADVLKAGHHGSKNATSKELLDAVRPDTVILSCGKNNRYGHPSAATMERLWTEGCDIYRTDRDGAVIVEERKGKMKIECGINSDRKGSG